MKFAILICCLLLISSCCHPMALAANSTSLPLLGRRIVIDPGHGGIDPGACRNGMTEEAIVLALAKQLQVMLITAGAGVHLTRDGDMDLSDRIPKELEPSRKRRDILGRVELVNSWQPDVFLSLHVNAISSSRWRGAQVFYQQQSEQSAALAGALQHALEQVLHNTDRQPKAGDYRILNDSQPLAALLEVGFISNPEEAGLLADPSYRQQVAWAILVGLLDWWGAPQVTNE